MRDRQSGFTLIELSIVLAIIGLLAGGIMLGRGLLTASKVQAVLVDARGYSTAIQQFRDKYEALPGDMTDASRQWGRADGGSTGALCPAAQTSTTNATCDGNGDGAINNLMAAAERGDEDGWAWQQMASAGFLTGKFNGGANAKAATNTQKPGVNMPRGSLDNTMFDIQSAGYCVLGSTGATGNCAVSVPGINIQWSQTSTNNMLVFTATDTVNGYPQYAAISPKDAYAIDDKVDDGLPALGQVLAQIGQDSVSGGSDRCAKLVSGQAVYLRTQTTAGCVLYFTDSFQGLNRK